MDGITLVTGGAGFIGSHVVETLLGAGRDVRVLDDFSSGREENLDAAWAIAGHGGPGLQIVEGDVRDEVRVRDAVGGCEAVVHLAAVPSVTLSFEDPVGCDSVTHGGTVNVLREAVDAEVARFVLASSCAVYGDTTEVPIAETTPAHPLSPYADSKLGSERICAGAGDAGQIAAACLRFFNVFGPRQDPVSAYSGVISRFLGAAARGETATVYGDGRQTRDFVYVGDVVRAVLSALERPLSGVSVLNVGSGRETSVLDLIAAVRAASGVDLQYGHEPVREGDILRSCGDVGRARWVLGWQAETSLHEGIVETWRWLQQTGDAPAAPVQGRRD